MHQVQQKVHQHRFPRMSNIEGHHLVPLSLGGFDVPANIVHIDAAIHLHIHQTLNLEGRDYSKAKRRMRKLYNTRRHMQADQVEDIIGIQSMYFAGVGLLEVEAMEIHIQGFNVLCEWLRSECAMTHQYQDQFWAVYHEYCNALRCYYLS